MRRWRVFLVLAALCTGLLAAFGWRPQPAPNVRADDGLWSETGRIVVRAYYPDRNRLADLARWTEPWEVNAAAGYAVLDVSGVEYRRLLDAGFRVAIDANLTAAYNKPPAARPGQVTGIPGYPCYRTVEETFAAAAAMAAQYPQLATWTDIGDSWEKSVDAGDGYDLMVLRLTNSAVPGPKPVLFALSAIHAREYAPAELNTRLAEYLLQNYDVDADVTWLLDYHEIHLLLQANPDGRKQAETGLYWRKNTNQNYCSPTSTSRGADLNRNFTFQWGAWGGSSGNQCDSTYRGPAPASEPETQAVQNYVRAILPDQRSDPLGAAAPITATGVFLDLHSYSELVLWPWGFTSQPAPNGPALQTLGRRLAYFNGYWPEQAIGLYPTDGTTEDFAYGEMGLAALTFELGTSFFQSCGSFEDRILPDNLPALLYAARVARTPYLTPGGPDALNVALAAPAAAPGDQIALSATIDDTRFNHRNGTEPSQPIASAEMFVDQPPWLAGATAVPLAAADGSFNSPVEAVAGVLDTAGLAQGRHMVYVRGQDNSGQWGPVSAVFLHLLDPATAPRIDGQVLAGDTNLPLAATVSVAGHGQTTSDWRTGRYEILVISGTYDVTAAAPPAYGTITAADVTVADSQTTTQDFALWPRCQVFGDDVEAGNIGWTAQSPWAITTESAHSPTHAWTESPGGSYASNRNVSLTSPPIDLTELSDVAVEFWHICNTESGYDFCNVEVSTDGGSSWTALATYDGEQAGWNRVRLEAPQLNGQPDARLRFRFTSDSSIVRDGWHVDDMGLSGTGPGCIEPAAPAASFVVQTPTALGATTLFTNTSSGTAMQFAWDFGDGSATVAAAHPAHAYGASGVYTVSLLVTNTLGSDTAVHTVAIMAAPQASFQSNSPVTLGNAMNFTGTATGEALAYAWDFGDGSPVATDVNPVHLYQHAGSYQVTLTVTNPVGSDTVARSVLVAPDPADLPLRSYWPLVRHQWP